MGLDISFSSMEIYHVWSDETVCTPDDLEEYLEFMSDDYLTFHCDIEDIVDLPKYNDIVTLLSYSQE